MRGSLFFTIITIIFFNCEKNERDNMILRNWKNLEYPKENGWAYKYCVPEKEFFWELLSYTFVKVYIALSTGFFMNMIINKLH